MLRKTHPIFLLLIFGFGALHAQIIQSFQMGQSSTTETGLAGNAITDISAGPGTLWLGTGNGLSRTLDAGQSFESFSPEQGVGRGSVSAIWTSGDTIWISSAADTLTKVSESYLPLGTGLSVSIDNGQTWRHFPQPGETPIQNLTYDIAVLNGVVWITSYGGGLSKSEDWGETWVPTAPDSFNFNPGDRLNHRAFSAIVVDDELWVGTAGGINKSMDSGLTWKNFNHTNQQKPISGNFIVAMSYQRYRNKSIIWAATWKAEADEEFYAVSKTEDGGLSWSTTLKDEKAHNFAFDDSVVYVATDNGLYKSLDFGETWYLFPPITDTVTGEKVYTSEVYSAYAEDGTLWVGSADGLAKTSNNGHTWEVSRAFQPTGEGSTPRTYAYPNPFSPLRHNQLGNDGYVRFQYNTHGNTQVTIKVFDFAMDLVATVVENKARPANGDFSEVWNGRNDYGDAVANGVYFYHLELAGDGDYWGKVMIVN